MVRTPRSPTHAQDNSELLREIGSLREGLFERFDQVAQRAARLERKANEQDVQNSMVVSQLGELRRELGERIDKIERQVQAEGRETRDGLPAKINEAAASGAAQGAAQGMGGAKNLLAGTALLAAIGGVAGLLSAGQKFWFMLAKIFGLAGAGE